VFEASTAKTGTFLYRAPKIAPLLKHFLVDIRPGYKSQAVTNALAYYTAIINALVKSFMIPSEH
jgi:hypothetical protein